MCIVRECPWSSQITDRSNSCDQILSSANKMTKLPDRDLKLTFAGGQYEMSGFCFSYGGVFSLCSNIRRAGHSISLSAGFLAYAGRRLFWRSFRCRSEFAAFPIPPKGRGKRDSPECHPKKLTNVLPERISRSASSSLVNQYQAGLSHGQTARARIGF